METEFWAAIAGAVIGGGITAFGQFVYERQRAWEAEKAKVVALFFKCLQIHTDLVNAREFLAEGFARARAHGMLPAAATMSTINRIVPVQISAEELSVALRLVDDDLLNLLVSLERQHQTLSDSFDKYAALRAEIDNLGRGGRPDHRGMSAMGVLPEETELYLTRLMVASNMLVRWRDQAERDYHCARQSVQRLAFHMRTRYGQPMGLTDKNKPS